MSNTKQSKLLCEHCRYFKPYDGEDEGACRRHAPVIVAGMVGPQAPDYQATGWHRNRTFRIFPTVLAGDWCGEGIRK